MHPKRDANAAAAIAITVVGGTAISASAHVGSDIAATTVTAAPDQATSEASRQDASKRSLADELAVQRKAQVVAAKRAGATKRASVVKAPAAKKAAAQRKRAALHRWVQPVKAYNFRSDFGARWGRLHAGVDLAAPVGTPVYAMSTGVATFAGQKSGYGNTLIIQYWDGTKSLFGHLSTIDVKAGQHVKPQELVAKAGNTGRSYGPHLHLEIRPKTSVANRLAHAQQRMSQAADSVTLMASNDALARAGEDPAPVDPVPWMKARGIALHAR